MVTKHFYLGMQSLQFGLSKIYLLQLANQTPVSRLCLSPVVTYSIPCPYKFITFTLAYRSSRQGRQYALQAPIGGADCAKPKSLSPTLRRHQPSVIAMSQKAFSISVSFFTLSKLLKSDPGKVRLELHGFGAAKINENKTQSH